MENKIQINNPRGVGRMVPTLARTLSSHKSSTSVVPELINLFFERYPDGTTKYKFFIHPETDEEIRYDTLDDFLEAKTPIGLQCTREDLRKWAEYAEDRIKQVVKDELNGKLTEHGTNRHTTSRVVNNNSTNSYMKSSSSEAYIISRLKRDNPEMAQKVLSGELSAHQASIKTGIRKKYIQVQDNPAKLAEKLKATWSDEKLEELRILLYEL